MEVLILSELYDKKELKKQSRDFRTISSRTLTSDFQMFGDNLKRLINFIDNNEIIKNGLSFDLWLSPFFYLNYI